MWLMSVILKKHHAEYKVNTTQDKGVTKFMSPFPLMSPFPTDVTISTDVAISSDVAISTDAADRLHKIEIVR